MTSPEDEPAVERVLIVLDAACRGPEAVVAAAEMAARLGVELAGLFIEDINLFRVAALPVSRHLSAYAGAPLAMDAVGLASELRVLASQAEEMVATAARRLDLRWTFHTARGDLLAELAAATAIGDLVVIGSALPLPGMRAWLRSPLGSVARNLGRSTLLLPPRPTLRRPLAVVSATSRGAERVLGVAARLASTLRRDLDVVASAESSELMARLEAWAADSLAGRGIKPRFLRLEITNAAHITEAARASGADILVMSADARLLSEDGEELVIRSGRPILLVR